jgi:hypothetical protein
MTPEITLLLGSIIGGTGALLSYWAGWRARGACRPPRGTYGPRSTRPVNPFVSELQQQINDALNLDGYRRGTTCGGGEITRAQWDAARTTFAEGLTQRGNGNGGPTTPKPLGYQPRSSRPGANPPPREP